MKKNIIIVIVILLLFTLLTGLTASCNRRAVDDEKEDQGSDTYIPVSLDLSPGRWTFEIPEDWKIKSTSYEGLYTINTPGMDLFSGTLGAYIENHDGQAGDVYSLSESEWYDLLIKSSEDYVENFDSRPVGIISSQVRDYHINFSDIDAYINVVKIQTKSQMHPEALLYSIGFKGKEQGQLYATGYIHFLDFLLDEKNDDAYIENIIKTSKITFE